MGPHTFNFAQAAEAALNDGAALRVEDMATAIDRAIELTMDSSMHNQKSANAQHFAGQHGGATQRTIAALREWLIRDSRAR